MMVRLLLEKNANINGQGGADGSVPQAPSTRGYQAVVRLLVEAGVKA